MHDEITWHIGKDDKPQDSPPYRAYFYWKLNGKVLRSENYSEAELQDEIDRRLNNGEPMTDFEEALNNLRNKNGTS